MNRKGIEETQRDVCFVYPFLWGGHSIFPDRIPVQASLAPVAPWQPRSPAGWTGRRRPGRRLGFGAPFAWQLLGAKNRHRRSWQFSGHFFESTARMDTPSRKVYHLDNCTATAQLETRFNWDCFLPNGWAHGFGNTHMC